jgi:hypothetical protein
MARCDPEMRGGVTRWVVTPDADEVLSAEQARALAEQVTCLKLELCRTRGGQILFAPSRQRNE